MGLDQGVIGSRDAMKRGAVLRMRISAYWRLSQRLSLIHYVKERHEN